MKKIDFYKDFDNKIENVVEGVELNLEFDIFCRNEYQAKRILEYVERTILEEINADMVEINRDVEE